MFGLVGHVDLPAVAQEKKARQRKHRPIILRPIGHTIAAEIALHRLFLSPVREVRAMTNRQLLTLAARAKTEVAIDTAETPAITTDSLSELAGFFRRIRQFFADRFDGLAPIVMEIFLDEERRHRVSFGSAIKSQLGVDVSAVMRQADVQAQVRLATERHVSLIKGTSDDMVKRITHAVLEAANKGVPQAALAKDLNAQFGWGVKRSRLIARDQMASFNATLNETRQKQVGVEEYVWVTSQDERVRPAHSARHGKKFRWDSPPSDGHPGQPINCRCVARAILSLE